MATTKTRTPVRKARATKKTPASKRAAKKAATRAPGSKQVSAPVAKVVAKKATPTTKALAGAGKTGKKKVARVRGTFVMPEADFALIAKLKLAAKRTGFKVKKSELLRLGLQALNAISVLELQDRILSLRVPEKNDRH